MENDLHRFNEYPVSEQFDSVKPIDSNSPYTIHRVRVSEKVKKGHTDANEMRG
jgi:hypothetical protein